MQIIYQNDHKNHIYLFMLSHFILVYNNFECNLKTCLSIIFEYEFETNLDIKYCFQISNECLHTQTTLL
jgi:hypothetical protein